jgi:ABC-type amino acid transport substrate-binding protein
MTLELHEKYIHTSIGDVKPVPFKIAIYLHGNFAYLNSSCKLEGLFVDMWEPIKKHIINDYVKHNGNEPNEDNIYIFTIIKEMLYDESVLDVSNGVYDMIIADYDITMPRQEKVLYTTPVMTDKDVIVYKPVNNDMLTTNVFTKLFKKWSAMFIYMVLICLIVGTILYLVNGRTNSIHKSIFSVFTGIAGSIGSISEQKQTSGYSSLFFIYLIILFVVVVSLVIKSFLISQALIIYSTHSDPHKYNLTNKNILVAQGTSFVERLKKYGAKPIEFIMTKSTTVDEIAQEYLSRHDKDKLSGFYVPWLDVKKWLSHHPEFRVSPIYYMHENVTSFIVNPNKPQLLTIVNKAIYENYSTHAFDDVCKKYMDRSCFSTNIKLHSTLL